MFLVQKNKNLINWQPTATCETLRIRAEVYNKIRNFFKERGVLEVETPLMGLTGSLDLNIQSIPVFYSPDGKKEQKYYLQTSPEFSMKRLLCGDFPSIYQLGKVFRNGESGRYHNPEFTMLEWYRINFTHFNLMEEIEALLALILNIKDTDKITYQDLFKTYCDIDPFDKNLTIKQLESLAFTHQIMLSPAAQENLNIDDWLGILLNHIIEPQLGFNKPVFIYDYPPSQAALAKITNERAERFELYINGIELANGYHELSDATIQEARFNADNEQRVISKLPIMPIDYRLIEALKAGLPPCAGVALGIDRLIMLLTQKKHIKEVLSFTSELA
ncbi:MAG: lysyl-tRNA synthetase [Francisellaceae bacterium]|nr:lysyl-tRNA synthetase [Francisellaceae bacterium]